MMTTTYLDTTSLALSTAMVRFGVRSPGRHRAFGIMFLDNSVALIANASDEVCESDESWI